MIRDLLGNTIAIVGGGRACKAFLEFMTDEVFEDRRPRIVGVADVNQEADGIRYARALGIPTTADYTEFLRRPGLQTLLELTNSAAVIEAIRSAVPPGVKFIDHFEARAIRDFLMVAKVKIEARRELGRIQERPAELAGFLERVMERFAAIIERRNRRSREIEIELVGKERTLYQIIEGSTIPTFVINKDHIITHWNRALEKLTGFPAGQQVGTSRQWAPFYDSPRPAMADVILDQPGEDEIERLYGKQWRRSALIEGAYEAEGFFPKLGAGGKWCWFTAAPLKSPDGRIVGAIETLWDKTEDKRAEQERERRTAELSTMVAIYSALNAPGGLEERIRSALGELKQLVRADGVCLFLLEEDGRYHLHYGLGLSEEACRLFPVAEPASAVHHAGERGEFTLLEELPAGCDDEIRLLEEERLYSLAYVPIKTKDRHSFGVIRIGSRQPRRFSPHLKDILELIGNRIAAAIENARLQEQLARSEEKYRTLFDSDPNPIFILNPQGLQILDTNQTAQACYGYTPGELIGLPFTVLGPAEELDVQQGLQRLQKGQSVLFSKKRQFRKGRRPFFVNINVSRTEYGGRDVLIATTTDITESVEKEAQLVQAGKLTTLGVMAAGMAHEINQPLNVIQVCADYILKMLKKGKTISEDELRSAAQDIIANVARAAVVIKHVREFSRTSDILCTRLDINNPIRDVFKILGHQIKAHNIDAVLELDPGLPPVLGDHNRLEQVFVNLVSNAIDAIDEKRERPDIADPARRLVIRSALRSGRVVVEVADTGVGMSEEVKGKLFEPFFTTKKTGRGTGLGTSISYGIVKDYGGTIEVESQPGRGTTFRLSFPAAGPQEAGAP